MPEDRANSTARREVAKATNRLLLESVAALRRSGSGSSQLLQPLQTLSRCARPLAQRRRCSAAEVSSRGEYGDVVCRLQQVFCLGCRSRAVSGLVADSLAKGITPAERQVRAACGSGSTPARVQMLNICGRRLLWTHMHRSM